MMRQAGRSLPAYRALRERYAFMELVHNPELMARITLMPLDVLDVDAAVLFADIMLPLASLGVGFEIVESIGPVVAQPIRSRDQVDALPCMDVAGAVPAVFEAIRMVRNEAAVPLIGFSGAPFTLACYLVEGRPTRDFAKAKRMMLADPCTWHALMERLTNLVVDYLREQIAAGVDAVQLFDSWVGALAPVDYETCVLPYSKRIFSSLAAFGIPRIHFGTGTAGLLPLVASADCEVVSVDWRIDIDRAWNIVGAGKAVQGNLEPGVLLGSRGLVRERARAVLQQVDGRDGHIFNLGHGVLPGTPLDNLKVLVDTVHAA
jgi:uroporphyrinogen decarboxylase